MTPRLRHPIGLISTLVLATSALPAHSDPGSTVTFGSLTVDGLTVKRATCTMSDGGMLAGMTLVGALAKRKAAVGACDPAGAAANLTLKWGPGTPTATTAAKGTAAKLGACLVKALKPAQPVGSGSCTLTLLTVDNERAQRAADVLAGASKPAEPAGPAEPKKTIDDLSTFYANDANWTTMSHDEQGWSLEIPKGATVRNITLELDGVTWHGADSKHNHQLVSVLWDPKEPLTPSTLEHLTAQTLPRARGLQWEQAATVPAQDGKPSIDVDKAFTEDLRLLRFAVRGARGSTFVLGIFAQTMPDDVVVRWVKSAQFQ